MLIQWLKILFQARKQTLRPFWCSVYSYKIWCGLRTWENDLCSRILIQQEFLLFLWNYNLMSCLPKVSILEDSITFCMDIQSQNHNFPYRFRIADSTNFPEIGGKESQKGKTEQYCKYEIDAFQTRIMNGTNTCNTMYLILHHHTAPQYMLLKWCTKYNHIVTVFIPDTNATPCYHNTRSFISASPC